MAKQSAKQRFAVGAHVRVIMPGVNGVVVQADDEPRAMGEYWHVIRTKGGDRKDPGCNLELIPQPVGGETGPSDMQNRLVEYFRSLEAALDEHKEKGTPAGDPVYDKTYKQLAEDLAGIGVGQDQIESLAEQCGHGSTVARLQKLRKRPIGFSS